MTATTVNEMGLGRRKQRRNTQQIPSHEYVATVCIVMKPTGAMYTGSKLIETEDIHLSPLVTWKEIYDWLHDADPVVEDFSELVLPSVNSPSSTTVLLRKEDIQSIEFGTSVIHQQ